MSGKQNTINTVANDDHNAKSSMMDLWRESIERTQRSQHTPSKVAESKGEAKSDLEQRIRNGQEECPTCAARTYADESSDGGVSFQAARHISGATAGVVVMNHEHEHVSEGKRQERADGSIRQSTVALEYGTCPDCGKTYVKGGVTRTTTRPASYGKPFTRLDAEV